MIKNKYRAKGFSLIEVLVSLLIIGVGLLGLSGLQIASMKGTNNAHSRTIASLFAMEMTERMRANPLGVDAGFYETSTVDCSATAPSTCTAFCSPKNIAKFDVFEIMCGAGDVPREGGIQNQLINGTLEISCDPDCNQADIEHEISISWDKSQVHEEQNATSLPQEISLKVIP